LLSWKSFSKKFIAGANQSDVERNKRGNITKKFMAFSTQIKMNARCMVKQIFRGHWSKARFHWAGIIRAIKGV
jgi:hypothetical protein